MTTHFTSVRFTRAALLGVAAVCVFVAGCRPPVDRSNRSRSGFTKVVATPAPAVPPVYPWAPPASRIVTPQAHSVFMVKVVSQPHSTAKEAEMDALERAENLVAGKLAELDPPVRSQPSQTVIREQYIRNDTRVVRGPNEQEAEVLKVAKLDPNQQYMEFFVEVTEDQLRHLRMHDRATDALRATGGLLVIFFAGFLFLRADEWTRGYLTSWLGLFAALGVVGGLVAVVAMG